MYGYNNGPTEADKRAALSTLRQKGIAKVEIEFSGGNDEGGAERVRYLDAEGNEMQGLGSPDAHQDWQTKEWKVGKYNMDTGRYEYRAATADEVSLAKLNEVLQAPIYDRYGSFAGEFYVDGTLVWDVAAGTNKMSGQEELRHWESFEV